MAHAGEHHGDAGFVCSRNHLGVAHRTTWLDYRGNTGFGGVIDAIPEREKRIAGHHRTGHRQAGMLGLDRCDPCGVDPAHLSGTDPDCLPIFGVDDGIGLDELGYFPGENQVVDFLFGRGALSDDLQVGFADHPNVAALYQKTTVDALEVPARCTIGRPLAAFEQAYVGFACDHLAGLRPICLVQ